MLQPTLKWQKASKLVSFSVRDTLLGNNVQICVCLCKRECCLLSSFVLSCVMTITGTDGHQKLSERERETDTKLETMLVILCFCLSFVWVFWVSIVNRETQTTNFNYG